MLNSWKGSTIIGPLHVNDFCRLLQQITIISKYFWVFKIILRGSKYPRWLVKSFLRAMRFLVILNRFKAIYAFLFSCRKSTLETLESLAQAYGYRNKTNIYQKNGFTHRVLKLKIWIRLRTLFIDLSLSYTLLHPDKKKYLVILIRNWWQEIIRVSDKLQWIASACWLNFKRLLFG